MNVYLEDELYLANNFSTKEIKIRISKISSILNIKVDPIKRATREQYGLGIIISDDIKEEDYLND